MIANQSKVSILDSPQTTQLQLRPGIIELNWGQPDPELLPKEAVSSAAAAVLARVGGDALSYGAAAGAGPLLAWLRAHIAQTEPQAVAADEIAITAGNSDAIDQVCTLFTQAGDVVLVESPSYHLALRIMRDHPLRLVPVATDEHGLQVELLAQTVRDLQRAGSNVRMLYTVPTFHNPTGVSLSAERRLALVQLAQQAGFFIVEDDVYRELHYDAPAPPALWTLAPRGTVLRLGSFAKSLAPGLRLGWINGSAQQVRRLVDGGLRDSGGGVNHLTAMVAGELCTTGGFELYVQRFRNAYRERRNALLAALSEQMPAGCSWLLPAGGFFVWVTLPAGLDATALLPHAEAAGMAFIPGANFHLDGRGSNTLRLAFSLYPPQELAHAAQRLGKAVRLLHA
ncbi:MAG: PLP-dependent aminotransferase family protein [Chloroflexi bacterium]|nr:PLP-dependent aminotransferase family protein [Chloroflexota bacterium]